MNLTHVLKIRYIFDEQKNKLKYLTDVNYGIMYSNL